MTEAQLREIEERAGKATEGPWARGRFESYHGDTGRPFRCVYRSTNESADTRLYVNGGEGKNGQEFDCDADAEFIAHARQDVPALVAEVRALKRALYRCERYMTEKGVSHEYAVMKIARAVLDGWQEPLGE